MVDSRAISLSSQQMSLLTDAEIDQRLVELVDWQRSDDSIAREWKLAEGANHHPDILVHGWNKVRLTLSTHSEGGLTDADFALAGEIDGLS
jgi:4a-hydroxytetrahydrobiopterin dehydratase